MVCRLTIEELLRLFSPMRENDDDQGFIYVEDKHTNPMVNVDTEDEEMGDCL